MRELQKKHYREVLKDNINSRCSSSAKIKEKEKKEKIVCTARILTSDPKPVDQHCSPASYQLSYRV